MELKFILESILFSAQKPLNTGELRDQDLPPHVVQSVMEAAQKLAAAGAEIVENVPMPNIALPGATTPHPSAFAH